MYSNDSNAIKEINTSISNVCSSSSTSFSFQQHKLLPAEEETGSPFYYFLWPVIITFILTHHHNINASVTIIIIIILCWNRSNLWRKKSAMVKRKYSLIECCVYFLYFIFLVQCVIMNFQATGELSTMLKRGEWKWWKERQRLCFRQSGCILIIYLIMMMMAYRVEKWKEILKCTQSAHFNIGRCHSNKRNADEVGTY